MNTETSGSRIRSIVSQQVRNSRKFESADDNCRTSESQYREAAGSGARTQMVAPVKSPTSRSHPVAARTDSG
jgi:hypothetical protein